MAHLSPRTKVRVHQISVFKKATGRSRRMVTAELMKKAEPPTPPKKRVPPPKVFATTMETVSPAPVPVPGAPRPIKRTRTEDHVYDSSGAPEVRRSVIQRTGVVPAAAAAEVQPATIREPKNEAALDSVYELHQRAFPPKEKRQNASPVRLASVVGRSTVQNNESSIVPNLVVSNGYPLKATERNVQMEQYPDYSTDIEAYRMIDDSVSSADVQASAPPTAQTRSFAAVPAFQENGFENLLRRVGSPEPVCPTAVSSFLANSAADVNGDSDALTLRPPGQTLQKRPASPKYVPPPYYFHGLYNLGNTCYMNTVIQLLYNLECFTADVPLSKTLPFRNDGIFLALRQVFQRMAQSETHETINPIILRHSCEKYMTDFEVYIQQDAQEYLLNILDKIEEEVAFGQRQAMELALPVPADLKSMCPTTRNFSCQVRRILFCESCDNIVNVEQSSRHFSLPLPEDRREGQSEMPDIEALMNIYFQVETLSRKCEKCGAETMKSKTKIVQLPRVLILHINRFEIDSQMLCSKVSVPVKFSDSIDLGNWCLDKVRGPSYPGVCVGNGREDSHGYLPALEDCRENSHCNGYPRADFGEKLHMNNGKTFAGKENGFGSAVSTKYGLHGVVSHVGKLASCGHYTVDIYDEDSSKYVRCDDSLVREVPPEEVFCEEKFREAYVLLYVLKPSGSQ